MLDKYPQDEQFDWRKEYIVRHLCGRRVRQFVASMSPKYFLRDEVGHYAVHDLFQNNQELFKTEKNLK